MTTNQKTTQRKKKLPDTSIMEQNISLEILVK